MNSPEQLDIDGGKYTIVCDGATFLVRRHGDPWRDLTGDKFVYCLFAELRDCRTELSQLRDFVQTIANLETEEDINFRTDGDGMSGDDAVETLSGLIRQARRRTIR